MNDITLRHPPSFLFQATAMVTSVTAAGTRAYTARTRPVPDLVPAMLRVTHKHILGIAAELPALVVF